MESLAALELVPMPETPDSGTAVTISSFDPRAQRLEQERQLRYDVLVELCLQNLEPGEEPTPEDLAAFRDTVEGQGGDLDGFIRERLLEIDKNLAKIPGCKERIKYHQHRKARAEKAIEVSRAFIERAMIMDDCVGKGKGKELDIATVSARPAAAKFVIVEESEIPAKYFVRPPPVVDVEVLKEHVMSRHKAMVKALDIRDQTEREKAIAKVQEDFGTEVPGCDVQVDGLTLTIKFG